VNDDQLSPLALASRDLVLRLSTGAAPPDIEAACRELLTQNTNGLGSVDTQVVEVASEILRGVLCGVTTVRSPTITAATRGVCNTGTPGPAGYAERLGISERACRAIRDSDDASYSDYRSALEGAAPAARMTADELDTRLSETPPDTHRRRSNGKGGRRLSD